ncbi:MAG: hypothetical protein CMF38_04955 [Legionellaceae bacterium]|nr:hypothetical protein [Legionellaceae bacterium]
MAPGNSIGTLTINGNYVQNPGSTYEVEINPQGQSDLINVTGTATINGGTVSVLKEAGTYTPQRYTIVTAAGGRSGTYDALVQMMPFLDIGLTYDANNVYLDVTRSGTNFPDVAQTPNQMSTAAGIESLGMGNPVYDAVLNAADTAQALLAFDTNSGELYSSLLSRFVEESRYARQAVLQHLSDASMTERMKRLGGRYLWAQGYGSWGDVDGTSNTAEVDRQTQGLFIGADMQAAQHTLGVMVGYSNSQLKAPARLSTAKSDNYTLGLYGRHDAETFIAKMGAAYTWQQFDVHRQAQLPTFTENLKGSHTAHTAQVFGQLNLVDNFTALHLQPLVGATYVTTDSRRWQEAGIAGLTGHNHFDTFYTHLGVEQGQALIETPTTVIRERVMLAWRHAYTGVYPLSTFAFTGGGNPFAIQGAPIAKDALVMDLGVDAALPQKGLNMRLAYIGQVGSQVQDHGLTGRVSWQFD